MEISRAFSTVSESVSYFFRRPGIGYYIPLYQREYSWDEENIEQLMDDICSGVKDLLDSADTLHFMGTIILVTENDVENNVKPQDPRALPTRIDNVIDGQQRLSTITLLACCLYRRICEITKQLPERDEMEELQEASNTYLNTLLDVFSVDLMRGKPNRKPILIRGSIDGWTLSGDDNKHYKSDVSSFLASFICAIYLNPNQYPDPRKNSLVADNLKAMKFWLDKIENAHKLSTEDFPPAWDILEKVNQVDLWSYQRPDLVNLIQHRNTPMTDEQEKVCSLVQLFAFCYFLLERCCLTLIQPVSQVRAFDMFQSLNATGTPLTALETFKPLVVNYVDSKGNGFQGSKSEEYFTQVEKLMSTLRSASSKNKRTNEYLNLFALAYDGKKLSKQFSAQRNWLIDEYIKEDKISFREEFVRRMSDTANYCSKLIYSSNKKNLYSALTEIQNVAEPERKEAILCLLYLQDAGHKMANTILSRFYALILRNEPNSEREFVFTCKTVAAFFTIWRSALPNTGLDDVYRDLLHEKMSWKKGNAELTVENLRKYFRKKLDDKGIGNKDDWKKKAVQYLRYDNAKQVCRFVLFVTSHDTIPDPSALGLMKNGMLHSSPYLEPSKWDDENFKHIEHVAPKSQTRNSIWDKALYENDDYEQIGNLTLLPKEINSSASNKGWIEKWIYYRHLAETDPDILKKLKKEAEKHGVNLCEDTIKLLQKTSHKHHIVPIVQLGASGKWDKAFVEKRTERICDILWDRMYDWLT
ncbi:hypothetical protein WA1_24170 [Scytonema hofmannii PCC 7110]|uniref:DUF262 domain-containing protein n=1 Tax=Scytonema hofmannii PCC 7110 TaxID=128403 RepID=A0A139X7R2_9CYAN|nr:DUF262 domain-containing HNH endonuclease family protein [Scytonema hofmannii]KYC40738.1 hypothetical protein WA1_24170 [Scytonema hofmannii PCC 7110]